MKFDFNRYQEFQKAYEGESDRSVAILASSYLENYLEEYLAKKFVDDKSVSNLFEGYGPLWTATGIPRSDGSKRRIQEPRSQFSLLRSEWKTQAAARQPIAEAGAPG
jgi:hypothetical protein